MIIDVDSDLSKKKYLNLDYKDLRGIAIMERYFEKQARETPIPKNSNDRESFRQNHGYTDIHSFDDVLERIKT